MCLKENGSLYGVGRGLYINWEDRVVRAVMYLTCRSGAIAFVGPEDLATFLLKELLRSCSVMPLDSERSRVFYRGTHEPSPLL